MDDWYEDLLCTIKTASDEHAVYECIRLASHKLGFEYCAFGMQLPYPLSRPKLVMYNNYCEQWQQRYQDAAYIKIDPAVLHGYRSAQPIVWDRAFFQKVAHMGDEARSFGLCHGWSQSCKDGSGAASLLTLARSEDAISANELRANENRMRWLASVAHGYLSQLALANERRSVDARLTRREVEILRFSADGKSAGEIAEILNLSKNTIDFHIKNAINRLNVANKTAAVARALTMGLLF